MDGSRGGEGRCSSCPPTPPRRPPAPLPLLRGGLERLRMNLLYFSPRPPPWGGPCGGDKICELGRTSPPLAPHPPSPALDGCRAGAGAGGREAVAHQHEQPRARIDGARGARVVPLRAAPDARVGCAWAPAGPRAAPGGPHSHHVAAASEGLVPALLVTRRARVGPRWRGLRFAERRGREGGPREAAALPPAPGGGSARGHHLRRAGASGRPGRP